MSTLGSSSTLAEVQAAYDDNASYREDADTTKAAAFITACSILMRRIPRSAESGGRERIEHELVRIENERNRAEIWLRSQGGSKERYFSVEEYR